MKIPIDTILKEVCKYYDMTPRELFRKTRKRRIVRPRHIFYYLASKYTVLPLDKIGKHGKIHSNYGQDHATVIHAKKTIEDDIWSDFEGTRGVILDITERLYKHKPSENELIMININAFHELLNNLEINYEEVVV